MDIHITARKFRIHPSLKEHATDAVKKLDNHFDGVLRCNVTLSFERTTNSVKIADISLHMFGQDIVATEKSDNYYKSIDLAVEKLERQLSKLKSKIRSKDKNKVRAVKGKV